MTMKEEKAARRKAVLDTYEGYPNARCASCGHPRRVHCYPPVRANNGPLLYCCQPYPLTPGSSCGCDGFVPREDGP